MSIPAVELAVAKSRKAWKKAPFILYDPNNAVQHKLLHDVFTKGGGADERFSSISRWARVEFYFNIHDQVRTMFRWEHLQYSAVLRKLNADNIFASGNTGNPFLPKVRPDAELRYRSLRGSETGVWDTIDVNVVLGIIWEILSRQEIMYWGDINKALPEDVSCFIRRSFKNMLNLVSRHPFTFEIVQRGYIRLVASLTF